MSLRDDLMEARMTLLNEQIRYERARADIAEMESAARSDQERDRLVKPGRERILPILDVIVPDTAAEYVNALTHWERRDPGEPIVVYINSPGGSVMDGFSVYDTLARMRRKGHHIITHGSGMVASMAAVLLQAGDERILDKRAKLLIHEGSTHFAGDHRATPGELEDMQTLSKMLEDDILDVLSERSIMSAAELKRKWKRRDWYMGAEEALALGFVDRIE